MSETTIVHVNVRLLMATVTYNGIARLYRLKCIDPLQLIALYKSRGYKHLWLNADTVLLTKKVKGLRRLAA